VRHGKAANGTTNDAPAIQKATGACAVRAAEWPEFEGTMQLTELGNGG